MRSILNLKINLRRRLRFFYQRLEAGGLTICLIPYINNPIDLFRRSTIIMKYRALRSDTLIHKL